MGWETYHLYDFEFDDVKYGEPDPEYQPDIEYARKHQLKEVLHTKGQTFIYTYDYGDNWVHYIELEEITRPKEYTFYPVCLAGKRACPPEDCGGITGYMDLLESLKDPEHEEHDHLVAWSQDFNPEFFDLRSINKELRRHANQWPMSYEVSTLTHYHPLPTITSIDRCVAVIKPKTHFISWLRSLPDSEITFDDIMSDSVAVLIPEFASKEEALEYVESNIQMFFEIQLHNWCRDHRLWPATRNRSTFRKWFDVEVHVMVHDSIYAELYREWPIRTRGLSKK